MTPPQARLYRWLVESRPHHIPFQMHFRDVEVEIGIGKASLHRCMQGLIERGWVEPLANGAHTQFQMVRPVKRFRSVPAADAAQ
jgi:DNA-binding MarR family transcriptional regulator